MEDASHMVETLRSMRPGFVSADIRSEFLFVERPVYPERFIAEFAGYISAAGLP